MRSATATNSQVAEAVTDTHLARRLLGFVVAHRGLFVLSLILYPLTAVSVVVPPLIVLRVLDEVIPARDVSSLHFYAAIYLLAALVEYAAGFSAQFAMSVLGQRSMRTLRTRLFARVQQLPASFFDRNPIGRVLTRLTNDVEALGEAFATGAVTVIGDFVTLVAVVGVMLWLDVRLTLFSFLVVPPLIGLTLLFRRYARHAFRDIRKHIARINTFLAEHLAGMEVVQLFRQERRTQDEFRQRNLDYRDAHRSAIFFDAMLYSVVEAIGIVAVATLIWFGAEDMTTGAVGAGTLVAFIQYIRRFFAPIRDLSQKYTVLQSAFAAAERVFSLLDEPLILPQAERPRPIEGLRDRIDLRGVWFSYRTESAPQADDDEGWILRDVDLSIGRGEKVALVGATGSGKSTILKVMNRSYDVQRGAVFVDGVDVREARLEDVRGLFAIVLQDVHLFSGTIMDNLTMVGDGNEEAARAAARAVQADAFIERLPDGYDTSVRELGSNFSAGERQLLAFARALAADPEVLILDEATSNVDSETEARIQAALDVLLEDRTAVVIAHRLSTIRKVDRIVVLQQGVIAEQGDHDTLMAKDGLYARLVELQFSQDESEER